VNLLTRFKWTISVFILFAVICGILFADFGPSTWWYVFACSILILFVFMGEVAR